MVLRLAAPVTIVALALGVLNPAASAADEVTDWNKVLVSALTGTNTSPQNSGRIAAITQAAVFDAVNGIDRRYTPYFVTDTAPRHASRRAAAVQAAYVALSTLLPAHRRQASCDSVTRRSRLTGRRGERVSRSRNGVGPIRRGPAPC